MIKLDQCFHACKILSSLHSFDKRSAQKSFLTLPLPLHHTHFPLPQTQNTHLHCLNTTDIAPNTEDEIKATGLPIKADTYKYLAFIAGTLPYAIPLMA